MDFAFTTQPNTLKGWGMGALVIPAQDMFYFISVINLQQSG